MSATQTAFLIAVPVLLGALLRIPTGMLADRFGGRAVFALLMIVVAAPAYMVPTVPNYRMLLYVALFLGMAGSSFAVGTGFVSRWFPPERLEARSAFTASATSVNRLPYSSGQF